MSADSRGPVQSVARALALLELVVATPSVRVSDLAAQTGLSVATTHRLLSALAAAGYVTQDVGQSEYRLGGHFLAVARSAAAGSQELLDIAKPHLLALRDEFDETVNLVQLDGWHARYLDQAESSRPVRMFNEIGAAVDIHASAAGKAMLAAQSEAMLAAFYGRAPFKRSTEHTIVRGDEMHEELSEIASRGYALDRQERDLGVICVAAAVPSRSGTSQIALSVSGPADRMAEADLASMGTSIVHTADRLAGELSLQTA